VITYLGFRVIEGAIARIPRRLAYALGAVISTLAFPLLGRQRKALESNLRHVRPDLPGPQVRKLAWQNWLNYTKAWIDFFKIPRMDRARLVGLLTPIGVENLDRAMAAGKGVIVVAPHMGSWELAAASWAASFGQIGVMAEQIEPRRLFAHVFRVRSKMGIKVIPLSQTGARDIIRMLKDGRMVVLAMDRDILNTGQPFPFFGQVARFPTGPVEIALKTGAPILPAYCVRDRNDRYVAVGGEPLFLTKSEDHARDVRSAMEAILQAFEGYIKMYPDQWHVLEPIWADAADGAVTVAAPTAQAAVGDQGGSLG
jgi:KDO2-lipid IV(A) lauroyltransferase